MKTSENTLAMIYLAAIRDQLRSIKILGDRTLSQLHEEQMHFAPNEESNSIAVIVKHLCGNMKSRWTDFLTTDGEKEGRDRDDEFVDSLYSKEEILRAWETGWDVVFAVIDALTPEHLTATVFIRAEEHTVVQAIERQMAHYSNHVGQIIYLGKQTNNTSWTTLTIARGKSKEYVQQKLAEIQVRRS